MRRATLVFGVLAVLLLADGAYLELTNNEVGGDQGSFFGDPHFVLSAGATVLIAGGLLLIVTVVMWLAAARHPPRLRGGRSHRPRA
jgi:hypothetical protein